MPIKYATFAVVCLAVAVGWTAPKSHADTYIEEFTVTSNSELATVGWSSWLLQDNGDVVDWSGNNSEPSFVNNSPDYAFFAPRQNNAFDAANGPGLLYTTEPGLIDIGSLDSLFVDVRADGANGDQGLGRFAIRIGPQWYAADDEYLGGTANLGPGSPTDDYLLDSIVFTDGTNWRELTVTPGAGGAISVAGAPVGGTLSGDVDAFGVYMEPGNNGDHFRIDNFTVNFTPNVVPEPMAISLAAIGALLVGMLMRRRRRIA